MGGCELVFAGMVTLGGAVRIPKLFNGRDKLFFMGNYESFRKRGSVNGLFSLAPAAFQASATRPLRLARVSCATDSEETTKRTQAKPISRDLICMLTPFECGMESYRLLPAEELHRESAQATQRAFLKIT